MSSKFNGIFKDSISQCPKRKSKQPSKYPHKTSTGTGKASTTSNDSNGNTNDNGHSNNNNNNDKDSNVKTASDNDEMTKEVKSKSKCPIQSINYQKRPPRSVTGGRVLYHEEYDQWFNTCDCTFMLEFDGPPMNDIIGSDYFTKERSQQIGYTAADKQMIGILQNPKVLEIIFQLVNTVVQYVHARSLPGEYFYIGLHGFVPRMKNNAHAFIGLQQHIWELIGNQQAIGAAGRCADHSCNYDWDNLYLLPSHELIKKVIPDYMNAQGKRGKQGKLIFQELFFGSAYFQTQSTSAKGTRTRYNGKYPGMFQTAYQIVNNDEFIEITTIM
jgi:hypothetical protein